MVSLLSSFLAVIPVFGLILAGYLAGRSRVMGPNAGDGLSRFVIWLALPALLFDIVANARLADLWRPGFIAVFGLSGLITLALAVAVSRFNGRNCLVDAVIEGSNASYPNVAGLIQRSRHTVLFEIKSATNYPENGDCRAGPQGTRQRL